MANIFERLFSILCGLVLITSVIGFVIIGLTSLPYDPEIGTVLAGVLGWFFFWVMFLGLFAVFLDIRICLRQLVNNETKSETKEKIEPTIGREHSI